VNARPPAPQHEAPSRSDLVVWRHVPLFILVVVVSYQFFAYFVCCMTDVFVVLVVIWFGCVLDESGCQFCY